MVALPDRPAVFVVGMPDLRAVPASALSTFYLAGENMNPTVAVSAGASALQFILNLIEDLRIDDGFVILFDIVLRDLTFIDFCLFGQEVDDEGLLQECVTLVFFHWRG